MIAPDLVATVAHAVEGFPAIWATSPILGRVVTGKVIGLEHDRDLALVRLSASLPGHVFRLAPTLPKIGTNLVAIGFSQGGSVRGTFGHVTDTYIHTPVTGPDWSATLSGLLQTDAAINPGNSGGPWLTRDGAVVGLSESVPGADVQGSNLGVPSTQAVALLAGWEAHPQPPTAAGCVDPESKSPAGQAALSMFRYFNDIDNSDYASAYAQLDPVNHPASGVAHFTANLQSSNDTSATDEDRYFDSTPVSSTSSTAVLDVRFRSEQDAALGPDKEPCTDWQLRYHFVKRDGVWLIHSDGATPGTAGNSPCPAASSTPSPSGPPPSQVASVTPTVIATASAAPSTPVPSAASPSAH